MTIKTLTKLSILLSLVCLLSSAARGQQKLVRKARKPSPTICKVAAVPKGMVIVGYKTNTTCAAGMELLVKRPAASETVCADSPVPDGYTVEGMRGSTACNNGDSNPLTNALSITDGDMVPIADRENFSRGYSAPSERRRVSAERQTEERAQQVNTEARLENATARQEIMVGMNMAQVQKAWGTPNSTHKTTRSGSGTNTRWTYKRRGQEVDLYFDDNNILSSYVLDQ